MSLADQIFVDMCKDIIENGTSTEGEKVRPVWEDGTSGVSYYAMKSQVTVKKESEINAAHAVVESETE